MDILEIMNDYGVDAEVAKKVEKAINKAIPLEFVAKDQYNKKVLELDETKKALKSAEGGSADVEAYKTKAEQLEKNLQTEKDALATFKADVEAEKTTGAKKTALKTALIDSGVRDDDLILDALMGKFSLDSVDVEGGKVKGWDKLLEPVKSAYGGYFGNVTVEGANVANPPPNSGGEPNPWKKGEHHSLERQTEIYRKDPEKARQMAAAAGVKL